MAEGLDTLVVDEAGQLSLANVVAVAPAASNLILVGDPRQLAQPSKGTHPDGAGASALDHVLDGATTMPSHVGLFLDRTWRLHPDICTFISEQVYDGRLEAEAHCSNQRVADGALLGGTGLRWLPVQHEGNRTSSVEEAEAVGEVYRALLGRDWTDHDGEQHTIGRDEILVVAPYNAQVRQLADHLPDEARVGTVDKFQGQEAPVVIVSLAASSAEDVPRGMEFLYSRNRLNVAVSRAKALCVMVGSPSLLDVRCRSVEQMRLANVLCRYVEMATTIDERSSS
jgi:superfamily I DNA and/or RNA helicase